MVEKLIKIRKYPLISYIVKVLFIIIGVDIPKDVVIGKNVKFPHNSYGTVIHPNTIIGDNVTIYQNVTIGRADIYRDFKESRMQKIIIENGAILCAGCKVLCKDNKLVIGKNSIIAANAVLTNSTKENEVWGGIPAKKIK
ncbi:hypothetical protein [Clostridium perfringens]|uniref:hypothetical protein n=1 Tax=Clostridium perfringens TaxID=1502 RepID=UPI0024BD1113|nr:hypothetical protein [Clostridium perfringens]